MMARRFANVPRRIETVAATSRPFAKLLAPGLQREDQAHAPTGW